MGQHTKTVTDDTFATEVLQADGPVLVDFWAEWCGPCRMVEPVLDEIAGEYEGKITIAKVNVDENPHITRNYQIMSIPTMSVFSKGELVKSIVGAKPKAALLRDLSDYIG
jgi:thioredoxin 1